MFLLELDPDQPIDFTHGRNRWGHAIHGSTFSPQPRPRMWPWQAWAERRRQVRRWSFMCHTSQAPRIGRRVRWTGEDHATREGVIYDFEGCSNVDDMFTLYVTVEGDGAPK